MSKFVTAKEAFRLTYSRARKNRREGRVNVNTANVAYWAVERAEDELIQGEGYHYEVFLAVSRAVLWAYHWRFCEPVNSAPKWASELHMGFYCDSEGCDTWWDRPRLP